MAIAKPKPIRIKKLASQAKSSMQQPIESQKLRKSKIRQQKLRPKPLKQQQKQQQRPMRRSQLMRNAHKPILPLKSKSKLPAKSRLGVAKSRQAKAATANEHAKKQPKKCRAPRKNLMPAPPMCGAAGLGIGAFYAGGLPGGVPRRQAAVISAPKLLPLMDSGIQGQAYHTSCGINGPIPLKAIPRNAEVEVPLTTPLPIIDFISTDEFERLLSAKRKFNKRL